MCRVKDGFWAVMDGPERRAQSLFNLYPVTFARALRPKVHPAAIRNITLCQKHSTNHYLAGLIFDRYLRPPNSPDVLLWSQMLLLHLAACGRSLSLGPLPVLCSVISVQT